MLRLLSYLTLAFSLGATAAGAQHYPDHPVKVMVGYAAGSGPDIQARTISVSNFLLKIVPGRTGLLALAR